MYLINDVKVDIDADSDVIKAAAGKAAGARVTEYRILKRAIDARRRPVKYVLNLAVKTAKPVNLPIYKPCPESVREYIAKNNIPRLKGDYIVVGAGPAGLFAAMTLLERGANVTVIERGSEVEKRMRNVENFNNGGELDTESNIQFGEGGAGTFSDGKLNTGVNNPLVKVVLHEYRALGANEDVTYSARPHIGTDILFKVAKNFRARLISLGAEMRFDERVTDLKTENGNAVGIVTDKGEYRADGVILAIGHSARDTYRMLTGRGVITEAKAFAVGARIEHDQEFINRARYGADYDKRLPSAEYKLAARTADGRGCFTFCMCPGGYVTAAASERGGVVTNGMSLRARNGKKANSALLVGVTPDDFGGDPKKAIEFQRNIERAAYDAGKGYKAPAQSAKDLLSGTLKEDAERFNPTYPIGVITADLSLVLPDFVVNGLKIGINEFERKMKGFSSGLLIGVETRSSAPLRIVRGDDYQSNIKSLYPCGEGAGYSGGITSSAADGIRAALSITR